jgi:hypothetical protein
MLPRCSETIGALAGALAKAQAELTNPAKSLTATIPAIFPREAEKTFRYAPLAAGLDLVRKSLSQQEIAVVQTTAVDKEAGLVQLTTVLAHSSGEWMASDWPVCPVSETAAPHRMGTALTYARRYALFALVGIAGEDDLDAPDLPIQQTEGGNGLRPNGRGGPGATGNGMARHGPAAGGLDRVAVAYPPKAAGSRPRLARPAPLPEGASAARRDELLAELAGLSASADLDRWASAALPAKNALTADDAHVIEAAFAAKLAARPSEAPQASAPTVPLPAEAICSNAVGDEPPVPIAPDASDFERHAVIPKARRLRDKRHREFVAAQPCLICGREPSDAHHLRFAQPKALGRKVSDEFTVPVCRTHHREIHQTTKEREWWLQLGIDPLPVADKLWMQTHPYTASAVEVGNTAAVAP